MPSGSTGTPAAQPPACIGNVPHQHRFPHRPPTNHSLGQGHHGGGPLGSSARWPNKQRLHTHESVVTQSTGGWSNGTGTSWRIGHNYHEGWQVDVDYLHDLHPLPNRGVGKRSSMENVTPLHLS